MSVSSKLCLDDIKLEHFSGKGVKVAVIDSGVDENHHLIKKNVIHKINLMNEKDKKCKDLIGHGTACCGIIIKEAPNVELLIIKIFDKKTETTESLLIKAIDYCINYKVKIINLSLGVKNVREYPKLERICKLAAQENIIVIAAEGNFGIPSYPANYKHALGVESGEKLNKYGFRYRNRHPIEVTANGKKQIVSWRNGSFIERSGNSIASSHVTGFVSLIAEVFPSIDLNGIKSFFSDYELKMIETKKKKQYLGATNYFSKPNLRWMKRTFIFPFDEQLLEMFKYKLYLQCDLIGFLFSTRLLSNKILVQNFKNYSNNYKIFPISQIENLKNCFDTVIIGSIKTDNQQEKEEIENFIFKIISMGKNVYSFTKLNSSLIDRIFQTISAKRLFFRTPSINLNSVQEIIQSETLVDMNPIVSRIGIFGKGEKKCELQTQLILKKSLQKNKFPITCISSFSFATLYGLDFTFPIAYSHNVNLPFEYYSTILRHAITKLTINFKDLVLISGKINNNYSSNTYAGSIDAIISLSFLLGCCPNTIILCIDICDDDYLISNYINTFHSLIKAKILLIVIETDQGFLKRSYSKSFFEETNEISAETKNKIQHIERQFSIPATEIVSKSGRTKLFRTVKEYYLENKNNE